MIKTLNWEIVHHPTAFVVITTLSCVIIYLYLSNRVEIAKIDAFNKGILRGMERSPHIAEAFKAGLIQGTANGFVLGVLSGLTPDQLGDNILDVDGTLVEIFDPEKRLTVDEAWAASFEEDNPPVNRSAEDIPEPATGEDGEEEGEESPVFQPDEPDNG